MAIAREAQLHAHQRGRVAVVEGQIIITPVGEVPLTLEQRLAAYDPERHGGEVMTTTQHLGAKH